MGTIVIPNTFADGTLAESAKVNANFTTYITEFNGNITDANIKSAANIDGSKLLPKSILVGKLVTAVVLDTKYDYSILNQLRYVATARRMAMGRKEFTFGGGAAISVTVTFSSDSDNGDPSFTGAPRVVGSEFWNPGGSPGSAQHSIKITAISNLSVTFEVRILGATSSSTGYIDWIAIGQYTP